MRDFPKPTQVETTEETHYGRVERLLKKRLKESDWDDLIVLNNRLLKSNNMEENALQAHRFKRDLFGNGSYPFVLRAHKGETSQIKGMGRLKDAREEHSLTPLTVDGMIYDVSVLGGSENRGIAQEVVRALIQDARKRRMKTLGLEVFADNYPALRVYTKLGFVHHSTVESPRIGKRPLSYYSYKIPKPNE